MATSAWSAFLAQYEPAAMMHGFPATVLVTMMVSCLDGFDESQSDSMVSAEGAVSEKNR
jgi:ABC-type uncharacterized transport system permease subunit